MAEAFDLVTSLAEGSGKPALKRENWMWDVVKVVDRWGAMMRSYQADFDEYVGIRVRARDFTRRGMMNPRLEEDIRGDGFGAQAFLPFYLQRERYRRLSNQMMLESPN